MAKNVGRRASEVTEIIDEANNVVLIFTDADTFADYEKAELTGGDFDFNRIEQQVLELSQKLDNFLEGLREIYTRPQQ